MPTLVTLTFIVLFSLTCAGAEPPPQKVTLKEAFESALKKTEGLSIQQNRELQSSEKVSQIKASLLPSINLLGTYTRQQEPEENANAFNRPDQSTARLTVAQPIFRGLREFAEWRSAEKTLASQQALTEQSKVTSFGKVARAFFTVLQTEQDLINLKTLLNLTEQRSKELLSRVKIGRSRRGEYLTSESQIAALNAQIEAATGQVEQARENLALLTALPINTELKLDSDRLPTLNEPLESFTALIEKRFDVIAQKESEDAAHEKISSAWGGHLPSVDLTGNYYFKRAGILENVKWDFQLTLTIPLFQGGVIASQVREASERWKEQALQLSQTRRNAETEVRTSYTALSRALTQHRALKAAVETSEENYKEQTRDYRYGLVTNLDVIQALNTFQETKRQLDRVYFDAKQNEAALLAAVGKIP